MRPLSAWYPGGWSQEKPPSTSRNFIPQIDVDRCNQCSFCWIYCPEGCIKRGDIFQINYAYCKGCGVCAKECPKGAIVMVKEG
ncbi:MAG: 4Fe-4S binding protein [Bacillota bacterium]